MKNTAQLFSLFKPLLFSYTQKLKASQNTDIPTFLFHGSPKSGKEWTAIKTLQALNCKDFLLDDHNILHCKVCSRINNLKAEYGIYALFSHIQTDILEYYLSLAQRNLPLDTLSKESFSHELAKLSILLESQFIKEQKSSPSKKIGITKLQEYTEKISSIQHQLLSTEPLHSYDFIFTILKEVPLLSYDISIEYLKYIMDKIKTPNVQHHYRGLIIKDPTELRNQPLLMNALLKTVEESKKNLIIFFISHKKNKILQTIQSRTTGFHFDTVNTEYIKQITSSFPLYPTIFFKKPLPSTITLEEVLNTDTQIEEKVIQYLEQKKAFYTSPSPLLQAKVEEIDRLLLGLKEYRISAKNIRDILSFL